MKLLLFIFFSFLSVTLLAQNTDDQFKRPLKDVLIEIESRYNVKIKYNEEQVKDKWLNYASWRFRPNVDETLNNVLAPLDLKVNKEKDKVYKLKEYEYYRWDVQDGWDYLDQLATQYHDKTSWEKRKEALRPELFQALKLSPLPEKPDSKPILTAKRNFDGYTVENFALEIMPGLYINGSIYRPQKYKGKIPVVLSPDGHWAEHRYRADCQIRCAMTAKMGAIAISYDLFGWGESLLQFKSEDHRRSLAHTVQTLGGIRVLDYILSLKEADPKRVGIAGGSGGGSHTVLMAALDPRINLSIPVVSLSSYFYGGCPCESGMPIHLCGGGTNNVEIAAMTAPNPQLVISDGKDWTAHMPQHDLPYLQNIYNYYQQKQNIQNVHLPEDGHDFGFSKRKPLYDFLIQNFNLNAAAVKDRLGNYDESKCVIEDKATLYAFGKNGENLPENAIIGFQNLEVLFK
jgi:dienelactone hydrolase